MQMCGFALLDPGKPYWFIRLVESSNNFGSDSEINSYQFEPVHATGCSDSEDDSSKSETTGNYKLYWALGNDRLMQVREMHAHARLSSGIKNQCCGEMEGLQEHLTDDNNGENFHFIHWQTTSRLHWLV